MMASRNEASLPDSSLGAQAREPSAHVEASDAGEPALEATLILARGTKDVPAGRAFRQEQFSETAATLPAAAPPPQRNYKEVPDVGEVIAGKYRVMRVLGMGGMGVVVAAEHLALRRMVAVKLLLPRAARARGAAERFLREARAAAAIESEHVARVMDVGQLESGLPYMVMEYLEGQTLEQALEARGALPVEEAVDHVLEACKAIGEAHALGVVHRDLKPANLFLASRAGGPSAVKVLDFGISKTSDAEAFQLTGSHVMLGSPFYMSPEQVRSAKRVDARTDVWALGVILYELLTGRRPFQGDAMYDVLMSVVADEPPRPRMHRPELPAELERIILACLAKDAGCRVQTVAELIRRLAPFGSAAWRPAEVAAPAAEPAAQPAPAPQQVAAEVEATATPARPAAPARRSWRGAAVAIALIAVSLGIALAQGVKLTSSVNGPAAASEPAPSTKM